MGAMIEKMDAGIGRVLEAIDREGLRDDTLVIFYSDNGGNEYSTTVEGKAPTDNHPLRSGKGENYEGGVRVPLIVRWPGVVDPGSVSDTMVSSPDFFPTILEALGLGKRPDIHLDGHSFLPALKGADMERPAPVFSHFPHYTLQVGNRPNTSLREGPWKLYRFWFDGPGREHRYELYHLGDDIGESTNLAERYAERVRRMDAEITRILKETEALLPRENLDYIGEPPRIRRLRPVYRDRFGMAPGSSLDGRRPEVGPADVEWSAARFVGGGSEGDGIVLDGQTAVATLPLPHAFEPGESIVLKATLWVEKNDFPQGKWVGLGFSEHPGKDAEPGHYHAWALVQGLKQRAPIRSFLREREKPLNGFASIPTGEPVELTLLYNPENGRWDFSIDDQAAVSRMLPDLPSEALNFAFIRFNHLQEVRLLSFEVLRADTE